MPFEKIHTTQLNRLSEDDFKTTPKNAAVLFLNNIRSMHNVGAFFRTADAFLMQKIILHGITPIPPHREIHKTALGAEDTVEWEISKNASEKLNELKKNGFKIIAIEQAKNSIKLNDYKFKNNSKYCFIFGNEVFGIDDELMTLADECIEIPQFGTKHSLNVSVSAGVILWEYIKQIEK